MSEDNDKIALDDISFDDMLGDGIETATVDTVLESESVEETKEGSLPESKELDEDVQEKEEPVEEKQEERDNIEPEEKDENDDSVVGQILEKLGYDVEEEYEDTAEGLTKLTQDLGQQMAEDQLNTLFEQHPLVQKHLEYVLSGGDEQTFMNAYDPNMDYAKMDLSEEDTRSQKSVLTDYFKNKGHDDSFINELLEDYEDTGKLFDKATKAREALTKSQSSERDAMLSQQKEKQAQQEKAVKEHWNNVYDTVQNSEEFAGLTVPKREKSKFFDYISKAVTKEGHTQRDLDHRNSEMEVKLAIDYLMYKGFNLSEIVDKKAKTKSVRSLKDRIVNNEQTAKSAHKASRGRGKMVDFDDLDLSI